MFQEVFSVVTILRGTLDTEPSTKHNENDVSKKDHDKDDSRSDEDVRQPHSINPWRHRKNKDRWAEILDKHYGNEGVGNDLEREITSVF